MPPFCKTCWTSVTGPQHSSVHSRPLTTFCTECGLGFTTKEAYKRHQEMNIGDPPSGFRCRGCGNTFWKIRKWEGHKCHVKGHRKREVVRNFNSDGSRIQDTRTRRQETHRVPEGYRAPGRPMTVERLEDLIASLRPGGRAVRQRGSMHITPEIEAGFSETFSDFEPEPEPDDTWFEDEPKLYLVSYGCIWGSSHEPKPRAPSHHRGKRELRLCPLCPPGEKGFNSEKALEMHLQSQAHVPQPPKGKGKKKKERMQLEEIHSPGGLGESTDYAGAIDGESAPTGPHQ